MQMKRIRARNPRSGAHNRAGESYFIKWAIAAACVALAVVLAGTAQNAATPPAGAPSSIRVDVPTPANQLPDADAQPRTNDQQVKDLVSAQANMERRKQIADDSANLLKLANDLKSEVDKTTKDTLSLEVIRKADQIEHLAHSFKEKTKLTAGAS